MGFTSLMGLIHRSGFPFRRFFLMATQDETFMGVMVSVSICHGFFSVVKIEAAKYTYQATIAVV